MAQGSAGLCATCATSDRRLCALNERTASVLKLLAPDVAWAAAALVCWECAAMLLRVERFREVATAVQRALLRCSENQPPPRPMSSLKTTPTTIDELLPNDPVKDELCEPQNIELKVKIEPETNIDFVPIDERALSPDSENNCLESIKKVKMKKLNRRVVKEKLSMKCKGEGPVTAAKAGKRVRKIPDFYKCKECEKEFKTRGRFEYHKESHRDKPQCEDCGRTFVSKSTLWTHRQLVHVDSKKWSCDVCKKVFFTEAGHTAHAASHRDRDRFYCRPCDKFFKSNSSYRKHRRSAARHLDPRASRFGCSACDRKFQTEERAREHYDIIHLQKNKFACRQCQRQYCTARALRIHERVKHENVTQPRDKVCEQCGKGFRTVQVLKSHIRTHTGERPYSCRLCPSRFTQNGALHTHNKLVHLNMRRDKKTS